MCRFPFNQPIADEFLHLFPNWPVGADGQHVWVKFSKMNKGTLQGVFAAFMQRPSDDRKAAFKRARSNGWLQFEAHMLEDLQCLILGGPASEPGGPWSSKWSLRGADGDVCSAFSHQTGEWVYA